MTVVLKDLARASRRETDALRSRSICTASAAAAVSRDNALAIFLLTTSYYEDRSAATLAHIGAEGKPTPYHASPRAT